MIRRAVKSQGHLRLTVVSITAFAAFAAIPAIAAVNPSSGVYQGCPKGATTSAGHCEGEGYFTLQGNKMKPALNFTTILAPSDFSCNAGALPKKKSITVSQGSFDYNGPAANQPGVTLRFKGAWTSAKTLKGYTRITTGSCDGDKVKWVMKTPPPA